MGETVRDVLAYLTWWEYMLWREQHRLDPAVEWQRDLSPDEVAEMIGVEASRLAPGDRPGSAELCMALYWPVHPTSELC